MINFGVLYRYELKKLFQKKILWVSLLICLLAIGVSVLVPLMGHYIVNGEIVDSNYNQYRIDQTHRKALSGRAIDQALLEETVEAYRHVPLEQPRYSLTEEYETYARSHSEIFNLIRLWTQQDAVSAAAWPPDETAFYNGMEDYMRRSWQANNLTERETAYWQARADSIETPLVYQYHDGYMTILEVFLTVGVMMILFIAISLSACFPDEHLRRTDQLIFCTAKGRTELYWVKLAAGLTAGLLGALTMTALTWALTLRVYGAEGFGMAVQIFYTSYAGVITIGQTCLIAYGCLLVTAVMISMMVMFLSELLHSAIAALSVVTGLLLASALIQVPADYRLLGQLWDYFPTSFLAMWNVFDCRLIGIAGHCFTSYQIVPLIYLIGAALLAVLGQRIYVRYEISGR